MNHEDFLEAEHKLHLSTDKAYRAHLKTMESLTARQVKAQEAMVAKLGLALSQQDTRSTKAKKGVLKNAK